MIKKLAESMGEYKKQSILAPIFMALEVIMETVIPLIMAKMIDKGITGGNMNALMLTGIALVISAAISLVFGALSAKFASIAATGFAANLRKRLFYKVQEFSFSNIDYFSTSGLVTRLTTDVTNIQNAYQMIIRTAIRAPFMLVAALAMSISINAKLGLVFLVVLPILAVAIYLIMSRVHPIFSKVFKRYDALNGVVQENLHGIRVVKSYVREEHEVKKFDNVSNEIYEQFIVAEKLIAFTSPVVQAAMYISILLVSWLGANLIVGGSMTTGELNSMFVYIAQILMSLVMVAMVLMMIIMARASAIRVFEVLEAESTIVNPQVTKNEMKDGAIVFDHVSFRYQKESSRACLQDIDLSIAAGETVGIIGGTGSGKSSLVQLIPRLYDTTEGKITVGGIDVRDYDMEYLRDNVAVVLQKNILFKGTIKENLRWGNKHATDAEMEHVCKVAAADDFVRTFPDGYDTMIEQGGSNVSGGQRQRLCIARALLKKPKVLILDDSTSAVDTKTDASIRKALREEMPETTKIIIAQRIVSVQDADKIIVLDDGKIDAIGTHETLLKTSEIYREVFESQQKGGREDGAA